MKVAVLEDVTQNIKYLELKDELNELEERHTREIGECQQRLNTKKIEANQLIERIEKDSLLYEEKLSKLEMDLEERMNTNIKEVFDNLPG